MHAKHRRTLEAVFRDPVSGTIKWRDIEAMLIGLGAEISEGSGSRIRFSLRGRTLFVHRPHPSPDARRYVVRNVRQFLSEAGIGP
ncbi:type II toxin-antitoxin system HicA family toxin [Nitratireductor mangrovi]|uniref:Type II toxin-antitoxin system HicA family toxin n=1 Tax=Nitratireductor mangrovi TaxID=2599600 RepID=A0A5B8L4S9_9HYPH|nr:type II toxin-antitoxin system HicA family toxin [Nitratireductor mangrovi]QDZ03036.1 type II toxin-antitoxin system HicA family toxin [Nitratireductor mangrovi]